MKVLLLGRSGQVGYELQRLLAPGAQRIAPAVQLIAPGRDEADLQQPALLAAKVRDWRPDVILNAAAYTAVDAAEKEEARAHTINADAPRALAQEAARLGALLVHYSTDYVFDGSSRKPYREDDPVSPVSAYGRTKLAGEQAIRDSGCRHLILRTSWVYAPRGKNFVLTMLRLANERPELRVVADQVGSPTSARSLAVATVEVLDHLCHPGRSEGSPPEIPRRFAPRDDTSARDDTRGTYHATGAGVTSWHGFAERIVEKGSALGLCRKVPVRPIVTADYPTPARRPAYSVLDNGRLLADWGGRLPAWEEGLDECLGAVVGAASAATGRA